MKLSSIYRIYLFLLLTIGIVYIVVYFNQRVNNIEGFLTIPSGCSKHTVGGRLSYLCSGRGTAEELFDNADLTDTKITEQVCYTDSSNTDINPSSLNNRVFVCFDMNGEMSFDETTGTYTEFDPILDDDQLPIIAEQDAITNRLAFAAGHNSFKPAYDNVSTIKANAKIYGYDHVLDVRTKLTTLSNSYCVAPIPSIREVPCSKVTTTITKLNEILDDRTDNSLFNINSVLNNSENTIKGIIYNTFIPGFDDSHVIATGINKVAPT